MQATRGRKRKTRSHEGNEIERISFAPQSRDHQIGISEHEQHESGSSYARKKANSVPIIDRDAESPPTFAPPHPGGDNKSSRSSNLDKYLMVHGFDGLNPLRPPDTFVICDKMPRNITPLAPCLFQPRPPPALPQHIMDLPFDKIMCRYNNLTTIVDNYLRWHGLQVFGWWTERDLELATSVPAFTEALSDRPAIPPYILQTPFNIVLLGAPVMSHLIERYHTDLGYDYFGFYASDPRVRLSDPEPETDEGSDGSDFSTDSLF
ncbi:hypothetical protein RRF57_001579 [Xylaria bambusicola]|uniref:Uncharacterized protein n=1 Tax=Xylaria bambusicola TaxID=326684 RepID=A0AAN7UCR6_9PEZI